MRNKAPAALVMFLFLALVAIGSLSTRLTAQPVNPVRIAVIGLTHGHVNWILGRPQREDIRIVGIYEPNRELAERYSRQHGFEMSLVFDDLNAMLDRVRPEAATAFNATSEHLEVVRACAPRGIHVMVEKPLAFDFSQAQEMAVLAGQYGIHILTNYETTWYDSVHAVYRLALQERAVGDLRKIVVRDGHQGPREIGVSAEFLDWLTDPVRNGGGALTDFGCYGANLITWLMKGARPLSVTAVTQQFRPQVYPRVDDEATILLTYPAAQGIIQASWNWPFSRKDMDVYGTTGYVQTLDNRNLRFRLSGGSSEESGAAPEGSSDWSDPFAYLAAVVRGAVQVEGNELSSLPLNLTVVEILDAARRSAASGQTVLLTR